MGVRPLLASVKLVFFLIGGDCWPILVLAESGSVTDYLLTPRSSQGFLIVVRV